MRRSTRATCSSSSATLLSTRGATFRRELENDPRTVIEREVGTKFTDEEFEAALAELKRNGLKVKHGDS